MRNGKMGIRLNQVDVSYWRSLDALEFMPETTVNVKFFFGIDRMIDWLVGWMGAFCYKFKVDYYCLISLFETTRQSTTNII